MDSQAIFTAIGSLGFPIVACVGLFWYLTKTEQAHKEEMTKMSEAINNNTAAMNKLIDRIERSE